MKKLLILIVLCLCCVVQAEETDEYITAWLSGTNLAYRNTNLSALLGFRRNLNEEFDIEIGPALGYQVWTESESDEETESELSLGVFAAVHAIDFITISNPFADDIDWLPKTIAGEPYLSIKYLIDVDGKGAAFSPGIGARIFDVMSVAVERRIVKGEDVDDETVVGISAKFKL